MKKNVGKQSILFHNMKRGYRVRHIAYCELRGKTRDQIEKPGPHNWRVDEKLVSSFKSLWKEQLKEEAAAREHQKEQENG